MSEEKKKKHYYNAKEKKAGDVRKETDKEIVPYSFKDIRRDFDDMMERFQSEFDDFWNLPSRWSQSFPLMPFKDEAVPSMDLEDRGKDLRVTVDLPGFKKEDVGIEVTDDSLVVNTERTQSEEEKEIRSPRENGSNIL